MILCLTTVNFLQAQSKQLGTLIGTNGSWASNPDATISAAVDGDVNTFFDGPQSQSWIGYDYGSGNEVTLSSIKFFPRNSNTTSLPDRMQGNRIYGSNTGYEGTSGDLLYTFPDADTGEHLEGQYDYRAVAAGSTLAEIILDPMPSQGYQYIYMYSINGCNVGEIEFWGTSTTLGINDINTNKQDLVLYPNPSIDNFSVNLGSETLKNTIDIKVYSVLGELVLNKTVKVTSNTLTINHNLNSGIYVVKINGKTTKLTVK
ncbi:T9SS type A sorting domain-containing protein [Wenyingzhuangia sp. IMCC45467]